MTKRGMDGDKVRGWQTANYVGPWTWMLSVMGPSKGFERTSDIESENLICFLEEPLWLSCGED